MPIAHITLAVRDVRRSASFFAETLGWRPIDRPNDIPMPGAWLDVARGWEMDFEGVAASQTGSHTGTHRSTFFVEQNGSRLHVVSGTIVQCSSGHIRQVVYGTWQVRSSDTSLQRRHGATSVFSSGHIRQVVYGMFSTF